ncbi:hypothetical protein DICPUDRAFT_77771 [Dictyostelium purpureum]|uniref:Uncharacterized protein n=1 Tax=Dictyostelium purpureum TaxID=5786 RepID=F0ZHK1_DICPU|nr:uncharacterized protein DICPUDRAFT_77771 [Dictyostelium purpureum]EGC36596.1 hypothetical protein DICPUDRAFT_77771 [Dictyostelium purpureum]|eukprot:XP_003286900.1 hypothetical protein DICPUDRAFT_77771 [Dictyostelium purpureum]
MCCSTPGDNKYYLTDFCGSQSACGPIPSCSSSSYFTADAQRFGCGKYLTICTDSRKCVKAKVIDSGPAWWVEQKANRPIIDASPSACRDLFGHKSCGWSDHLSITATIARANDGRPLNGTFTLSEEEYIQLFIDHDEALMQCEKENECNGAGL